MYDYWATILKVVDGDSIRARVDMGFRVSCEQSFRLMGYNAPEVRGPERELGAKARDELREILKPGAVVQIRTHKGDAFGRWLCDVVTPMGDLVSRLISEGWGVAWDGKGKRPGFDPSKPYPLETAS